MRVIDITVPSGLSYGPDSVKVHIERFSSCAEVISVCEGRSCKNMLHKRHDFFGEASSNNDPPWYGFKTSKEMKDRLRTGVQDKDLLQDVSKFVYTARAPDIDKLTKVTRDVCGGGVDAPRFLAGAPDCMVSFKKNKKRSDMVKVGINPVVMSSVSLEKAEEIGAIIAKAIYSMELAGYRVQVDAAALHGDFCKSYVSGMVVPLKKADAALSLPRLLYPLCDMSFVRGVFIGWGVQDPELTPTSRFSCWAGAKFNRETDLSDMYAKVLGEDSIYLDFTQLARMFDMRKKEESRKKVSDFVIAKFIGS